MQPATIFWPIGRTTRLVLLITGMTLVVLVIAGFFVRWLEQNQPSVARLPYYQFYFTIFSTILGGFVVAMIPAILAEARADFEQLKAARSAYSEAKTGFDYLKIRLITMTLSEAGDHLQQVHIKKHFAELFPQFIPFLGRSLNDEAETLGWRKKFL